MKHIKLFEQLDWDDPFGEETHLIGGIDLKIVHHREGAVLYIGENFKTDGTFNIHYNLHETKITSNWVLNPIIGDNDLITMWEPTRGWQRYTYKNLPSEIKNRLT